MAEFCLDCWNKLNGTNDPPEKYIISDDLDLCEGCGEYKTVIVIEKAAYRRNLWRKILFPLRVIFFPIEIVVRLVLGIIRLIRTKNKR